MPTLIRRERLEGPYKWTPSMYLSAWHMVLFLLAAVESNKTIWKPNFRTIPLICQNSYSIRGAGLGERHKDTQIIQNLVPFSVLQTES